MCIGNGTGYGQTPNAVPYNGLLPVDLLKKITVMGKFSGSHIAIGQNFMIDNLTGELLAKDGSIQIAPLTMNAYKGVHQLDLNIDLTKAAPVFKFTEQADNFTLEPVMKLLKLPKIIDGTAKIKMALEATGNTVDELKQSVNGGINLNVNKGLFYDLDITKLMQFIASTTEGAFEQLSSSKNVSLHDLLQPKATKWLELQKDNPSSSFDSFDFKADIKQGVAQTSSFALANPTYQFNADGSFNIVTNEIKYNGTIKSNIDLTGNIKEITDAIKLAPLTVPISGSFTQPIFSPDLETYEVDIFNQTQDALIKRAASSMVAAAPANDKTSKAADEIFSDSLKGLAK